MINKDKKDRVVRQFVTYCRMALRYEKINYYNERKRMAERESHMEMFSEKQLETVDKIFDTYHADYFYVMGLLWSSIFVTRMANKISFQIMKQSVPDKVYDIHYSCADEHGCMRHRQILPLPDTAHPLSGTHTD